MCVDAEEEKMARVGIRENCGGREHRSSLSGTNGEIRSQESCGSAGVTGIFIALQKTARLPKRQWKVEMLIFM